jgi:flagellar biosynthesis/type III secretory pathway protein FliH
MYRRITTLLSPLLLAALAVPVFAAPQALAAPPQTAAITAHQLFTQKQEDDYTRGYQDGYDKGHANGLADAEVMCQKRNPTLPHAVDDYHRGYADGYPKGYSDGFDFSFQRFCHGR